MSTSHWSRAALVVFLILITFAFPLAASEGRTEKGPCSAETSLWMLANLAPEPPDFYQLSLGYQRFIWEGLFLSLHATPFLQSFSTNEDEYLQSGFQLFLQLQLGYQVELLQGRFFLKPALSCNYWPVNTNLPDGFQAKENNWPDYFLFEPHLNIGFRF